MMDVSGAVKYVLASAYQRVEGTEFGWFGR